MAGSLEAQNAPIVIRQLEDKPGIYIIRNMVSGRVYVGSSYNVRKRWRDHFWLLRAGGHHSRAMQRSWVKHGPSAFSVDILEFTTVDKLFEREQFWIDELKASDPVLGFNSQPIAGGPKGTKASAETRAKLSAVRRGRKLPPMAEATKEKIRAARAKQTFSAETRAKISAAGLGRKMPPRSEAVRAKFLGPKSDECRRKISATLTGRIQSAETKTKRSNALKGRTLPTEQKIKMAITRRLWHQRARYHPDQTDLFE